MRQPVKNCRRAQQFWICTIWFSNTANAFVLTSDIIVQIQNVPQHCTVARQILYLNDLIIAGSHADGTQRFRGGSNTELLRRAPRLEKSHTYGYLDA
jgi:hypothetical protein